MVVCPALALRVLEWRRDTLCRGARPALTGNKCHMLPLVMAVGDRLLFAVPFLEKSLLLFYCHE